MILCDMAVRLKRNIIIKFLKPIENYNIRIPPLKYNKDFAYSLTFDDSLLSAYKVAFPILAGGEVSASFKNDFGYDDGGDGTVSSGLYYTDGCGNDIPFTAGIAITSVSENKKDIHLGDNNTYLSWENIIELYQNGWNILNHSYSHSIGEGTNYKEEIVKNTETVVKKTGVTMNQFVTPSGDLNYAKYVFDLGILALYSGALPGDAFISIDDNLNLENFKLRRNFLKSPELNEFNIMDNIDSIVKKNNMPFWYNEFTHSCGNDNIWNIGLNMKVFKFYMNYIYSKYGKIGKDNIWFAPLQDVYEYLLLKKYMKIYSKKITANILLVEFDDSKINNFNICKKSFSLILDIDNEIIEIEQDFIKNLSYNGALINLEIV